MHKTIESILSTYKGDGPIRCFWPQRIKDKVREFRELFRGRIVYAVKCNPDPSVLDALKAAGVTDFDVASINEIQTICEWDPDSQLYFQHPIKSRSSIASAYTD